MELSDIAQSIGTGGMGKMAGQLRRMMKQGLTREEATRKGIPIALFDFVASGMGAPGVGKALGQGMAGEALGQMNQGTSRDEAMQRGIPIAAFDAAAQGMAGEALGQQRPYTRGPVEAFDRLGQGLMNPPPPTGEGGAPIGGAGDTSWGDGYYNAPAPKPINPNVAPPQAESNKPLSPAQAYPNAHGELPPLPGLPQIPELPPLPGGPGLRAATEKQGTGLHPNAGRPPPLTGYPLELVEHKLPPLPGAGPSGLPPGYDEHAWSLWEHGEDSLSRSGLDVGTSEDPSFEGWPTGSQGGQFSPVEIDPFPPPGTPEHDAMLPDPAWMRGR